MAKIDFVIHGCLAHFVNNTFKFALQQLYVDVEIIILKMYNHSGAGALRIEHLKEFVVFVELAWQELIIHVKTRWLSLGPTNQILQFYPSVINIIFENRFFDNNEFFIIHILN